MKIKDCYCLFSGRLFCIYLYRFYCGLEENTSHSFPFWHNPPNEKHEIVWNCYGSQLKQLHFAEMLLEKIWRESFWHVVSKEAGWASLWPLQAPYYQAACCDLHE